MDDADVPRFWRDLGLPGLFDIHVHFLPPRILHKVWAYFDAAREHLGRDWPIRYQGSDDERIATLRALGVRRFGSLPYAHKPGVARFMNDWAADLARRTPDTLWSATFFPEPEAPRYVADLVADGVRVFKVHLRVGGIDARDPLLDPVWGTLAEAGTPVVVHAGSAPIGSRHTGPGPMAAVLARHPRLTAVIAHLGAPEYEQFFALAETYPRVQLDTTMACTDFFDDLAPLPRELVPRLRDLGDRVLLGSDFPNIPYPYGTQLEALQRLDLGDDWLRAVLWHNGARLFGETDPATEHGIASGPAGL